MSKMCVWKNTTLQQISIVWIICDTDLMLNRLLVGAPCQWVYTLCLLLPMILLCLVNCKVPWWSYLISIYHFMNKNILNMLIIFFSFSHPFQINWESKDFGFMFHKLIVTWWHHKTTQNWAIVSCQWFPMNRWQAITRTNGAILLTWCLRLLFGNKCKWNLNPNIIIFFQENIGPCVLAINMLILWGHHFYLENTHITPYCSPEPWYWCYKGDWKVKWQTITRGIDGPKSQNTQTWTILETPHTAWFNTTHCHNAVYAPPPPKKKKKNIQQLLHANKKENINSLRPSDAYKHQQTNPIGSDNGLLPGRCQAII